MTTSTRRRRGRLNLLNKHFSFAVELSKVIPGVSLTTLPLPVALPLSISLLLTLHPSLFYLACKLATWQLLNLQTALDECQIRCQARRSLYTLHRLCWVQDSSASSYTGLVRKVNEVIDCISLSVHTLKCAYPTLCVPYTAYTLHCVYPTVCIAYTMRRPYHAYPSSFIFIPYIRNTLYYASPTMCSPYTMHTIQQSIVLFMGISYSMSVYPTHTLSISYSKYTLHCVSLYLVYCTL